MKNNNYMVGMVGESLAERHLVSKGYRTIERNYRTRFGELDIVCWDGKTMVFVEVKTKIGCDFGEPEEMVGSGKLLKVRRMSEVYVMEKSWDGMCRVDVVAIVLGEDLEIKRINHYLGVY